MNMSLRPHTLAWIGLIVWGLFDEVTVELGDVSLSRLVLGMLYLVVGALHLTPRTRFERLVPAVVQAR